MFNELETGFTFVYAPSGVNDTVSVRTAVFSTGTPPEGPHVDRHGEPIAIRGGVEPMKAYPKLLFFP